jgi:hypothetical protein
LRTNRFGFSGNPNAESITNTAGAVSITKIKLSLKKQRFNNVLERKSFINDAKRTFSSRNKQNHGKKNNNLLQNSTHKT